MEKLVIVRTLEQLNELRAYLSDKDYVAFDTETTGVTKDSHIIGLCFAAEVDIAYYVVTRWWDVPSQTLITAGADFMQATHNLLLTLVGKNIVAHNAGFDCSMVANNYGIELIGNIHTDTMLLAHLLDENRSVGLKELGVSVFGEEAAKEQAEMKESVHRNGGVLTKDKYELYKADSELIGRYGAKDAILTLKLFYHLVPLLYEQGLDAFFYDDETMPLARGPTYQMNNSGLKVDPEALQTLRKTLEADILEARAFIDREVSPHVAEKYPGTSKAKTFNINANQQLSWLLFEKLDNDFNTLTKAGQDLCKALDIKRPYAPADRRRFVEVVRSFKGHVWEEAKYNPKTKKTGRPKKVADWWTYCTTGKVTMAKLAPKYKWVQRLVEYKKNTKLLETYVMGIQERAQYNVIRPSFLQHGTTSGRYSCKAPNFQNLPRDDKRVKTCIVARPGKVFVGADFSQLEPRVFASLSKDPTLLACFASGDDFYSVVGAGVFSVTGVSLKKGDSNFFGKLHEDKRHKAKVIALAAVYGKTPMSLAPDMGVSTEEAREILDNYFEQYPGVQEMMLESHEMAKTAGQVTSLYGRPRRMPEAKDIQRLFPGKPHSELPYNYRNTLNLAVNHRIQSTGASIMNRAAIAIHKEVSNRAMTDKIWSEVKIVLQVHDSIALEGPESLSEDMCELVRRCMETTTQLPGVSLVADPSVSRDLGGQK